MALPIKWFLPSLSEITSPSAGFPKTLSTSLENTQSCPCKTRARGLTTIPAIGAQPPTLNYFVIPSKAENRAAGQAATSTERPNADRTGSERIKSLIALSSHDRRCLDFARQDKKHTKC